jgi:hypothetical protein
MKMGEEGGRKMTGTNTNEESGWFEFLEPWQRK